jgi:hypothetical protein
VLAEERDQHKKLAGLKPLNKGLKPQQFRQTRELLLLKRKHLTMSIPSFQAWHLLKYITTLVMMRRSKKKRLL